MSIISSTAILSACGDPTNTSPSDTTTRSTLFPSASANDVELLTFALSAALDQPVLRDRIREDLRDSPFAHRIQFISYLRGARGTEVRSELARVLRSGGQDFAAIEARLPALELVMPKALDRVAWNGGADLQLMGTVLSRAEQIRAGGSSQNGYKVGGMPHTFVPDHYSPLKLLVIRPVSDSFPADAERVRAAAPAQARGEISTFAEERASQRALGAKLAGLELRMTIPTCDPDCPNPPPDPAAVANGGATLPSHMTRNYCDASFSTFAPSDDRDSDGVRDDCEFQIASALAPLLNLSTQDAAPGFEPYWAVSKDPDHIGSFQVMYAISYYEDAGDYMWGIEWHHGDSEFIILEVKNAGGSKWGVVYATLSAHWHAGSYDATATYYFDDLEYPGGVPYPRIWAAINKHPNYRSKEVCGWGPGGWASWDSCEGSYQGVRIPVDANRNLGNFFHRQSIRDLNTRLINCRSSWAQGRYGEECYWSDSTAFAGWNIPKSPSATPYSRMLEFYAF